MSGSDLNALRILSEVRISLEMGRLSGEDLRRLMCVCRGLDLEKDNPWRRSFFLFVENYFQKLMERKVLEKECEFGLEDVTKSMFLHLKRSLNDIQFSASSYRWFGGKIVLGSLLCASNHDRMRIVSIMLMGAVILTQGSSFCLSSCFISSLSQLYASTQEFTHDLLNSDDRLLLTVMALLKLEQNIPEDSILSPFRVIMMIFIDINFDHHTVLGWVDNDSMGLSTVLYILTDICSKGNLDKWLQAGGFKRGNQNKRCRLDSNIGLYQKNQCMNGSAWLIDECTESSKDIIITLNVPTSNENGVLVKKQYAFMKREPTRVFVKPSRLSSSSQFSEFELMVNMFIELQLLLNLRIVDIGEDKESFEIKELRTQLANFFDYLDVELDII